MDFGAWWPNFGARWPIRDRFWCPGVPLGRLGVSWGIRAKMLKQNETFCPPLDGLWEPLGAPWVARGDLWAALGARGGTFRRSKNNQKKHIFRTLQNHQSQAQERPRRPLGLHFGVHFGSHFGPFSRPFRERVVFVENARRVHGSSFLQVPGSLKSSILRSIFCSIFDPVHEPPP